jgi:transcriptional regulator GlxA family with amidase domain
MSLQTSLAETRIDTARRSNIVSALPSELLRIIHDLRRALETSPENASDIARKFLGHIASRDSAGSECVRGGLAPWQKRKIERHLTENLERSIPMEELAGEVKLSVSHFCRAFKKSFGETPHTYLVQLRLALARRLMLTTGDPLSQIALSCGFADQAHLSKLFRRILNDTPNAWRRRNLTNSHAEAA